MSFDIALSGIQAINEQLESTSNNIANAGTYGFKSTRANFASIYAGDQPTGVKIGSHTQSIGLNGGVLNTGRGLDAAINGRGFFVGKDAQGTLNYSRVGIFTASKDGYLLDSANRRVQGYAPVVGTAALGALGDVTVPNGQIPAVATTNMNYVGNLSSDWTVPAAAFDPTDATSYNMSKVSVAYDSLGTKHTVTQYFIKTAPSSVSVNYSYDGDPVPAGTVALGFDADGRLAGYAVEHASRCGYSADLSMAINDRAMFHSDNAYALQTAHILSHRFKTHTVSNTAFRGFGGPQGMVGIERAMDAIALDL
ncbi:MAG: flagellar hook-basal body complex protein, partial [Burkholderiaceae bacterium]|nr:flagellar hook-basal body complex protein [Burkholderiaceae bacterium]